MKTRIRENKTYQMRLELTSKMLGKNLLPTIQKDKYEEIETPRQEYFQQERKYKPITHEKAQELEYKALTSEGRSLYFRSYYSRAIESFSKALDINKEDYSLYVDRANCYIQIGDARSAIIDANTVLQVSPNDTRALLAKAEAFFSIGEFEFALVFFERGSFLRQDIQGFREGITKCKHAILDSINGEKTYQPNPNFSASRIRKQKHLHHNNKNKKRNDESENEDEEEEENQYEQENLEELLPEKVHPLTINPKNKGQFLGELLVDYEYLKGLKEEITTILNDENETHNEDKYNYEQDKIIEKCCKETINYLEQRSQFWEQQNGQEETRAQPYSARSTSRKNKVIIAKVSNINNKSRPKTAITNNNNNNNNKRNLVYETSRIQQYERKHNR